MPKPQHLVLYVLTTLFFIFIAWFNGGFHPGDMGDWLHDSAKLWQCLTQQKLDLCHTMSRFPFSYTLNSMLLHFLSFLSSDPAVLQTILNSLFLASPVFFLSKNRFFYPAWIGYVIVVLCSPLPRFYLFSGSIEIQPGVLTGIALWGLQLKQRRSSLLLVNAAWFFSMLYRDSYLFMLLLSLSILSVWYLYKHSWDAYKKTIKTYGPMCQYGIFAALFFSYGFNALKYGSILPSSEYRVFLELYSIPQMLSNAGWLLFSPNGGFIFFWGACITVSLGLYVFLQLPSPPIKKHLFPWQLGIVFIFLNFCLLTQWWTPFGWNAWGSRLMIPHVLTLLTLFVLNVFQTTQPHTFPSFLQHRHTVICLCLCGFISFPYILSGYVHNAGFLRHKSFYGSAPHCTQVDQELMALKKEKHPHYFKTSENYARCAQERFRTAPFL
jgi:hypothetical protein